MSSSDNSWIDRVEKFQESGTSGTIEKLLLLPVLAFFLQLADALEAIFDLIIVPLEALYSGIRSFFGALFAGVEQVILAGAAGSAQNVQEWFVFSFPVAVGVVVLVAMIIAWYTDQDFTSDIIPFSSTDVPIIGNDEED